MRNYCTSTWNRTTNKNLEGSCYIHLTIEAGIRSPPTPEMGRFKVMFCPRRPPLFTNPMWF